MSLITDRYIFEFQSDLGNDYDVYINDTDHVTGVLAGNDLGFEGFTLSYPQQNKDSPREILLNPSTVSMPWVFKSVNDRNFLAVILNANEQRFKLRIERGGVLFWSGFVVTDNFTLPDESYNSINYLTAIDGLGMLREIPYNDNGNRYTGRERLIDHIYNCLQKVDMDYFYGGSDIFLKVISNWYEDAHVVTSTLDPLYNTNLLHSTFYKREDNGSYTFKTCYEVLEYIMRMFGSKLELSDGVWRIIQYNERQNATFTEFNYNTSKTHISTTTGATYEATASGTGGTLPARLAGGSFPQYQPLNSVCIDYLHNGSNNLLKGTEWNYDETTGLNNQGEITIGNIDVGNNNERFFISGDINYTASWQSLAFMDTYRHEFYMKVKVGDLYLKRDIEINGNTWQYGPTSWTIFESYYKFSTPFITPQNTTDEVVDSINLNFETPIILQGGDIDFNFYWNDCLDQDGDSLGTVLPNVIFNLSYDYVNPGIRVQQSGNQVSMEDSRKYLVTNADSANNTTNIEIETPFGDGPYPTTFSRLQVWNGTAWEDSEDWRVDDTGTAYKLQELVIREILAAQKTSVNSYQGSIKGNIYAHTRIQIDSDYYLFEGGSFNANEDIWSGKWVQVARDTTGIDTETEVPDGPGHLPTGPGGTGTNSSGNGLSGGPSTAGINAQTPANTVGPLTNPGGWAGSVSIPSGTAVPYAAGDPILIMNPQTGQTDTTTVASATPIGSTVIPINGYLNNNYASGAAIIPDPLTTAVEGQTSGEVVSDFFLNGVVDKDGYFFKTGALQTEKFHILDRTTSISVTVFEFIWTVPAWLDGAEIHRTYSAFAIAGVGGNTVIKHRINGTTFETTIIGNGVKTGDSSFTTIQTLSEGDEYTVECTAVAPTTAPQGLNISVFLGKQPVYFEKLTYQLNRVPTSGLQLFHKNSFIPYVNIGFGSALFSSSSYISCGNDSSLDITRALSLMAWVKFDDLTTTKTIAGKYTTNQGYHLYLISGFIIFAIDSQATLSFSTSGMVKDKWYHLAATYDEINAYIYLNGEEKDTAAYTAPTSVTEDFFIGADDIGAGANFFTGNLSMVRVFDEFLTQDQVQVQMNKRFYDLTAEEKAGLQGAWELYDITATEAPDSTDNDNNGTIN